MSSRRYENLSNESLNLILGKYGKLPGEIEPDLLRRAESIGVDGDSYDENELDIMATELKDLCKSNELPDLSEKIEMLLTYIMFPNIALPFFKELDI